MNHRALFALLLIPGTAGAGEPLATVPVRSHDNALVLTISNTSTAGDPCTVTVAVSRTPQGVTFHPRTLPPIPIPPRGEGMVTLSFDVAADIPPGRVDTVALSVRAATGETWIRSFIWRFTGPDRFRLDQNHPNPFNPSTTISYALPAAGEVTLAIYDRLGRLVRTLAAEYQEAGYHSAPWDGRTASGTDAATGVYYCRLHTGSSSSVIRMLLLK